MTRLGIIGLSHDHVWDVLPTAVARDDVELIAATSLQPPLLERAEREYGVATYTDATEMAAGETLDAVLIYGNNRAGAEEGVRALERGWHVLIEKPLAADLEGADALLKAADATGRRLMVNWPIAWWPQIQQALALALIGEIGDLWQVRYRAAHQGPREMGASEYFCDWLYDPNRNGGGALIDYCCYGAILSRVLLGRPHSVTAVAGNLVKTDLDAEDNAVLLMQYPNALSIAEASWTQIDKLTNYHTQIYGTQGTLLAEPDEGRLLLATEKHPEGREFDLPKTPPHLTDPIAHFLNALETGTPFQDLCQPTPCRDAQEILQAGAKSATTGAMVELPQTNN
ncbi:MAG: oxidoreductase [Verrucomicrobiales bacterium]|nr:oxidoreductase [Verrucomicrobiales bacterium]|tara:strand:- start:2443 stop:3465 length:1023 start_codon:yes stop_codon:yes gene_type:complete